MANGSGGSPILWGVLGGAAVTALFTILRPKPSAPGQTQAGGTAPLKAPDGYESIGAVTTRFDQVRELYRMGYKTPAETIAEITTLQSAATQLQRLNQGDPQVTIDLLGKMIEFRADVEEFAAASAPA
jgi:hypothetical protein